MTAVASSGDGTRTQLRADQLEQAVVDGERDWETLLVLAVPGEELWGYVPGFETTAHPVDWIWGPGPMYEALEWWRAHEHERVADEVTALDREFFVRYRADDASPRCHALEWSRSSCRAKNGMETGWSWSRIIRSRLRSTLGTQGVPTGWTQGGAMAARPRRSGSTPAPTWP